MGSSILKYFKYDPLPEQPQNPEHLQNILKRFYDLALFIDQLSSYNHLDESLAYDEVERHIALRKLLEAKEAIVRSNLK